MPKKVELPAALPTMPSLTLTDAIRDAQRRGAYAAVGRDHGLTVAQLEDVITLGIARAADLAGAANKHFQRQDSRDAFRAFARGAAFATATVLGREHAEQQGKPRRAKGKKTRR
jgi:hypothetical protein